MNKRRSLGAAGYTMIEMLVTISVMTMVMTVTLSWIHASMKFSSVVKDRAAVHRQLSRLSADLRTRIALTDSIQVDGDTMKLDRGGIATHYTIKESVIERVQKSKSPDDPETSSIESFRIGRDVEARWGVEELPDWVSLTIRQKPLVVVSGDSSKSIGSLETPKLQFSLRAGPRKAVQ